MPKGRHGGKGKTGRDKSVANSVEEVSSEPSFVSLERTSPLLTLLFESKSAQHAALSRIEAFYESSLESQRYLTLEEAKQERLCQHYEAFNFPIDIVEKWLQCMQKRHGSPPTNEDQERPIAPWWKDYCNAHEYHLLHYLMQLGLFQEDTQKAEGGSPIYLVSTLSTKQGALQHERLHFLYYISAEYRDKVLIEYQSLSLKTRKIIETDLAMRKYSPAVYVDEFQAYISEDAGEFGKSIYQECLEIQLILKPLQRRLWKGLNL